MKQDCVIRDATAACCGRGELELWSRTALVNFQLLVRLYNNSKYVSVAEQTQIMQVDDLDKVEETTIEENKIFGEICNVRRIRLVTSVTRR